MEQTCVYIKACLLAHAQEHTRAREVTGRPLTHGPVTDALWMLLIEGRLFSSLPTHNHPKIAALCRGEAADLLQITLLRPAGKL